ncbi:MAG: tRNA preQ1(34) S-adenosylmethionine ribosyltransferase-isomerase QueA [Hyphomonadaceae bacterium]|nr:tRNA preQ1(34) S-adenosylmethionine ribosyltransferase-isomerase QueA [Hyphomonadaceae bacterium]
MRVDDFDFDLPEALIALRPMVPRDAARLLLAQGGAIFDHVVSDLPKLLRAGDVLIFNDTRTIPAALKAHRLPRTSAGTAISVDINLHQRVGANIWKAFGRPGKRLAVGDLLAFAGGLFATIEAKGDGGEISLAFDCSGPDLDQAIAQAGVMPLPPYIARKRPTDSQDDHDYQTIYAKHDGSVATPTAGLHFTDAVLAALDLAQIERHFVTLHVGAGTFLPVKVDAIADHVMHAETYHVSTATAAAINAAKQEGRRVIAVGTTSLRTLESVVDVHGRVQAGSGDTSIFITPGHDFKVVDGLMTNFHLPRSTLLMLVSALVGFETMRAIYAHAIAHEYRFYSYGDASLLWKNDAK